MRCDRECSRWWTWITRAPPFVWVCVAVSGRAAWRSRRASALPRHCRISTPRASERISMIGSCRRGASGSGACEGRCGVSAGCRGDRGRRCARRADHGSARAAGACFRRLDGRFRRVAAFRRAHPRVRARCHAPRPVPGALGRVPSRVLERAACRRRLRGLLALGVHQLAHPGGRGVDRRSGHHLRTSGRLACGPQCGAFPRRLGPMLRVRVVP